MNKLQSKLMVAELMASFNGVHNSIEEEANELYYIWCQNTGMDINRVDIASVSTTEDYTNGYGYGIIKIRVRIATTWYALPTLKLEFKDDYIDDVNDTAERLATAICTYNLKGE